MFRPRILPSSHAKHHPPADTKMPSRRHYFLCSFFVQYSSFHVPIYVNLSGSLRLMALTSAARCIFVEIVQRSEDYNERTAYRSAGHG